MNFQGMLSWWKACLFFWYQERFRKGMAKSKMPTETMKGFRPDKAELELPLFLIRCLKHVLSLTATYSRPEILINGLKNCNWSENVKKNLRQGKNSLDKPEKTKKKKITIWPEEKVE
jgi:hypothetical protein